MCNKHQVIIVTAGSKEIGPGCVKLFLESVETA
jgi:NAD(P)-dependent dehydrogenase (short-subunit alcohol dehydrogenase family)